MIILFAMECSLAQDARDRAGSRPPRAVGRSVGVEVISGSGSRRSDSRALMLLGHDESAGHRRHREVVVDLLSEHRQR
jgi:hypothetical protein